MFSCFVVNVLSWTVLCVCVLLLMFYLGMCCVFVFCSQRFIMECAVCSCFAVNVLSWSVLCVCVL